MSQTKSPHVVSGEVEVMVVAAEKAAPAPAKAKVKAKTKAKVNAKIKAEDRALLPEEEKAVESDVFHNRDLRLLRVDEVDAGVNQKLIALEGLYRRGSVGVFILGRNQRWSKNFVAALRVTFERDQGSANNNWTIATIWDTTPSGDYRPKKISVLVDKTSKDRQLVGSVPMKVTKRLSSLPGAKRFDDVFIKIGEAYKSIEMDYHELKNIWDKYSALTTSQKMRRTLRTSQMRERAKNAAVKGAKLSEADTLPTKQANKTKKLKFDVNQAKLHKEKGEGKEVTEEKKAKKKAAPLIDPDLLKDVEEWDFDDNNGISFGACPKFTPKKSLAQEGVTLLPRPWTADPKRDNVFPGSEMVTFAVKDFLIENGLHALRLKEAQACAAKSSKVLSPFAHQLVFDAVMRPECVTEKALVHWRTGSGKTFAMVSVLKNFYADSRPKIILVPNRSIKLNFYSAILAPDTPNPFQAYVRWYLTGPFYVPAGKIDSATRMSLVPFAQSKPHIFRAWTCQKCSTQNVFRVSCKKCHLLHPHARREGQDILSMKGKLQCAGRPGTLASPLRIFTYAQAGGKTAARRKYPILKYANSGSNNLQQTRRVAVFEDVVRRFVDANVVKAENPYNHCIIVCDEVHNMWDKMSVYKANLKNMSGLIRDSIDTVFVGMTATPLTTLSENGMLKQYDEIMSMLKGVLYKTDQHCLRKGLAERALAVRLKFAGLNMKNIKKRVDEFKPVFGDTNHGYVFDFDMLDPAIYPRVVPPVSELGRICQVELGSYNLLKYLETHEALKIPCDLKSMQEILSKQDLAGGAENGEEEEEEEEGTLVAAPKNPKKPNKVKTFELKLKTAGHFCNTFFPKSLGAFNFGHQWKLMQAATLYNKKLYTAKRTSAKLVQIVQDILSRPQEKTLVIVDQSFAHFELILDALYREKGTRWAAFKDTKQVRVSDDPRLTTNFKHVFSNSGQRDFVSYVSSVLKAALGNIEAKQLVDKLVSQLKIDVTSFAKVAKEVTKYVDLSAQLNAKLNSMNFENQLKFNETKKGLQDLLEYNEGEQAMVAFEVMQTDMLEKQGFKAGDVEIMRRQFVASIETLDMMFEKDYVLKDVQRCVVQTKKKFLEHHSTERPTLKSDMDAVELKKQLASPFTWATARLKERAPETAEDNETARLLSVAKIAEDDAKALESENKMLTRLKKEESEARRHGDVAHKNFVEKRVTEEKDFAGKNKNAAKYKRYKTRVARREKHQEMLLAKSSEEKEAIKARWKQESIKHKAKKKSIQKKKENLICTGTKTTNKWVQYFWMYTSDVQTNLATKFKRIVRKVYKLRIEQLELELKLLKARTNHMFKSVGTHRLEKYVVPPESYKRRAVAFINVRVKLDMSVPVYKKIAQVIDTYIALKKRKAEAQEKETEEADKKMLLEEEKKEREEGEEEDKKKAKKTKKKKKRPFRQPKVLAQELMDGTDDEGDEGDEDGTDDEDEGEEWKEEEESGDDEDEGIDAFEGVDADDVQELLHDADKFKNTAKPVARKASFNLETFEQAFEEMLNETRQQIKHMFCKFANQQAKFETADPDARYEQILSKFNSFTPNKGLNLEFGKDDGEGAIRTLAINAKHFSEGVSFFGVQRLVLVETARSYTDHRQRIGRVLRACKSHGFLSKEEQVVHIDQYVATIDQTSTRALLAERKEAKRPVPQCTVDGINVQLLEEQKAVVDAFMRENFENVSLDAGLYQQSKEASSGGKATEYSKYSHVRYTREPTSTDKKLKVFGPNDASIKLKKASDRPWFSFTPSERQANAYYKEGEKKEEPKTKGNKLKKKEKDTFECSETAEEVVQPGGFLDKQERDLDQRARHARQQKMRREFHATKGQEREAAWAPQREKEVAKAVSVIGKPPTDAARVAITNAVWGAIEKKHKLKTPAEKELLKRVRKALLSARKIFMVPLIAQEKVEWKAKTKPETDRRRKQSAQQAAKTRKKAKTSDKDRVFVLDHADKFQQLLANMENAFDKDQRKTGRAHVPNRKYED
jgi:hypothetical protein